ncbi:MAG: purine-nucleoside phosphorylase [Balneolales bacterium]
MKSNISPQESSVPFKNIAERLCKKGIDVPDCSIILGSGLDHFTNAIQNPLIIPYGDIPSFPETAVDGHPGALYFGSIDNRKVLAWAGRFHYYEGYPFSQTLLPIQVAHTLGCRSMIVTNAAGGINDRFHVGDLMLIDELITLMVSLSPYNKPALQRYINDDIINGVIRLAANSGIPLNRGCYIYTKGPNYETKAEVRAFRLLGADAVGMSTAAELYEAHRLGMSTLGISLITNKATGVSKTILDHSEIKKAARMRKNDFVKLLSTIITDKNSPLSGNHTRYHPL